MNDNKNRIDLAKVISKKTNQEENIAEAFINQFFLELSESIRTNPSTKIDGLGLFRIIKSSNGSKILFLEDNYKNHKNRDLHSLTSLISEYKEISSKKDDINILTKRVNDNLNDISSNLYNRKEIDKISLLKTENFTDTIQSEIKDKRENSIITDQSRIKNRVSPYKKTYIDTSHNSNESSENENSTIIDIFPPKPSVENSNKKTSRIEENESPDISKNKIQEAGEIDNYRLHENNVFEDNFKPKKKTFTSSLLLGIISLLSILSIVFIIYLLVWSKPQKTENTRNTTNNIVLRYKEVRVYDTYKYSYVIIPLQDTHIEDISQYYYGDRVFWPYIYYANIDFISADRIIVSGSIVKIPKLIINLVEYRKGTVQKRAEKLGNEILKNKK